MPFIELNGNKYRGLFSSVRGKNLFCSLIITQSMNIEELREECMKTNGVTESFPFNKTVLVFKIADKMFAYLHRQQKNDILQVNLKCETDRSNKENPNIIRQ